MSVCGDWLRGYWQKAGVGVCVPEQTVLVWTCEFVSYSP